MLRLDLLHPEVSGNKWFKLQYNLEAARSAGKTRIVTFGGAFSNHIAATAAACHMAGLQSTGIIRGEAAPQLSHTLLQAQQYGMELQFISREAYRQKDTYPWGQQFPEGYLIPEGGHNAAGVRGCEEILSQAPTHPYTHIMCPVGTGTTLAGLINSALPHQQVIGIVVLKGAAYLQQEIPQLLRPHISVNWQLYHDFHIGGYAKATPALITFMNDFYNQTRVPLDMIYTAKMVWAFRELAVQQHFPAGSRILLLHTGGLQGNLSLPPGVLCF
ncbi:pyridoxal-phosphate dependent enzyme [Chitinophaga agrisoli]|uniref:Pyridoxal-phosphate dependent enzyme n=2 Tax=Chitinophaga agrisoli TaxID=2607653 RepID=A0A5B2VTE2_9BACT|nr:pyridoxal-phosphate dependent enzyme [Chitinophaga agrisoli]